MENILVLKNQNESNLNFPLNIRIEQINRGKITITHETITVKSKTINFGIQNKNFIRIYNKEELDSIELATSLTSTEESFRKCYEAAKDLFKIMKLMFLILYQNGVKNDSLIWSKVKNVIIVLMI